MPRVARMFYLWMTIALVDGFVSATLSASNTAGHLTLVGSLVVVLLAGVPSSESGP
ncbi:MAG: hypothetical protein ABEJ26_14380 [Halosimplex sp.]